MNSNDCTRGESRNPAGEHYGSTAADPHPHRAGNTNPRPEVMLDRKRSVVHFSGGAPIPITR